MISPRRGEVWLEPTPVQIRGGRLRFFPARGRVRCTESRHHSARQVDSFVGETRWCSPHWPSRPSRPSRSRGRILLFVSASAAVIAVEDARRYGVVEPLPRRGNRLRQGYGESAEALREGGTALRPPSLLVRRRPERPGAAASDSPAWRFPTPIDTRRSTARRHRNPSRLARSVPSRPSRPSRPRSHVFTGNLVPA